MKGHYHRPKVSVNVEIEKLRTFEAFHSNELIEQYLEIYFSENFNLCLCYDSCLLENFLVSHKILLMIIRLQFLSIAANI